jgi:hypothetical protein
MESDPHKKSLIFVLPHNGRHKKRHGTGLPLKRTDSTKGSLCVRTENGTFPAGISGNDC